MNIGKLESQLNDFDPRLRRQALENLLAYSAEHPGILVPEGASVNMHCHSFFSFSAYGFSPSGLVWLAKKKGFRAAGIVDFDVLDGVEEFLDACDLAEVRGSAAMETRIYVPEFSTRVTNSPGEPGINYHTGIGFTSQKVDGKVVKIMDNMRRQAIQRNHSIIEKLNAYLDPVAIDYELDVLPLTPAGSATERHMLVAYTTAAERTVSNLAEFWADKLALDLSKVTALLTNPAEFLMAVRVKLMKRGGIAYIQPSPENFPTAEEFYEMVSSCGALPIVNYLDGTNPGEQCLQELLALLTPKGAAALNMIPNLAIPDPQKDPDNTELRHQRRELLYRNVRLAQEFDLPLHIGTEMNSYGQRQLDDLTSPDLAPVRQTFVDGAFFIYGHTRLQKVLGLGYQSEWARNALPTRKMRNAFYTQAGYRIPPGIAGINLMRQIDPTMEPKEILALLNH
jgi:hypothetical protein